MLETTFSQKLSAHARKSFREARDIARYTRSETIEPEHLLLAIFLENGSLGSVLLDHMGFEKESLAKLCLKKRSRGKLAPSTRSLPLSLTTKNIVRRAYSLANEFHYPYVGTEHLLCAILESEHPALDDILVALKIDEQKVQSTIEAHLHFDHFPQLGKMLDFPDNLLTKQRPKSASSTPALDQFTLNMGNDKYDNENILIGREQELARLIQILTRKNKNNPLIIGEPGVGKTALVSALAKKLKSGDVPHSLAGKRILSLDLTLVVAGTNFRGEFEARLKDIIKEASEDQNVILFIDEIHTIVGAGNTSGGLDAANILKPALARSEIRCIGATTFAEYKRHLEKDPALDRRFQTVILAEPTPEETKHILHHVRTGYERFHRVFLAPDIINMAVDLSVRYIPDRFLPDKALDIIDEASSLAKQKQETSATGKLFLELEDELRTVLELKTSLVKQGKYDEAVKWREREKILEQKLTTLRERKQNETMSERTAVTELHILKTVSQITGIPFTKLSREQPHAKIAHLRTALKQRLINQPEVAAALEQTLIRSQSGVSDPDRPLGSFLFLGPTGVGKTLVGKIIAEEFFGDPKALIRLDMSEFMERHSVAQILGAPAGYVGYGEGGKLTEKVRRRPYAVVLFDEIEKAHPDVWNILLQILDEGMLTDAEGRRISFKHTLIILTSNIGTAAFTQTARIGFSKNTTTNELHEQFENIRRDVLNTLKKEVRPELLARLDHILVFNALSKTALVSIARLEINALAKRLKEKGLELRFPATVPRYIAEKSFSPEQGGRLVRKNIQDLIEKPIAETLLFSPNKKSLRLSVKNDVLVCS